MFAELVVWIASTTRRVSQRVRIGAGPRLTSRVREGRCGTSWRPSRHLQSAFGVRVVGRQQDPAFGFHGQDAVSSFQAKPVGHILRQRGTDGPTGLAKGHLFGHASESSILVLRQPTAFAAIMSGQFEMGLQGLLFDYGDTLVDEVSVDRQPGNEWLLSRASFRPPSVGLVLLARASRIATEVADLREPTHLETSWPALTRLIYDFLGIRFDTPMAELDWGSGRRRCRRGRCREPVRRSSTCIE